MADRPPDPRSGDDPPVSLVTVNYGVSHLLPRLLDSVPRDTPTIIVDNFHSPAERRRARTLAAHGATVLESDNRGYAAGYNLASEHIPEDHYILLANPDAYFRERDGLRLLVHLASVDGIELASPAILTSGCGSVWFAGGTVNRWTGRVRHHGLGREWTGRATQGNFISGCLMLISPAARTRLAGMDESLFLYHEDAEYCLRAREAGMRMHVTDCVVALHDVGASCTATVPGDPSSLTLYLQSRNRIVVALRRGGLSRWAAATSIPFHAALDVARILRRGGRPPGPLIGALLLGYWHGILRRGGPPEHLRATHAQQRSLGPGGSVP